MSTPAARVRRQKMLTVNIPAAPTPAIPRPTSNVGMLIEPVHIALPIRNKKRLDCRAKCRPYTSATDAYSGKKTVDVRR